MTINILGKEIVVKKTVLILLIISISVILGCIGLLIARSGRDIIIEDKTSASAAANSARAQAANITGIPGENSIGLTTAAKSVDGTPISSEDVAGNNAKPGNDTIKVYVVGCVKKPGVITLKKGQIIDDAVRGAGGLTGDADASSINMVYILNENVMLYICSKKELAGTTQAAVQKAVGKSSVSSPAQDSSTIKAGTGARIITGSGSAAVSGQSAGQGAAETGGSGKININTASAAELDTLPGIGEATARDIISYREKNGSFKDIKDIMKIPRIKDSRFNAIKDLITVN